MLGALGMKTLFIELGSPRENGHTESFNGKMRDELLKGELIGALWGAKVLCGNRVKKYNTAQPHSALGFRPPGTRGRYSPGCRRAGICNIRGGTRIGGRPDKSYRDIMVGIIAITTVSRSVARNFPIISLYRPVSA